MKTKEDRGTMSGGVSRISPQVLVPFLLFSTLLGTGLAAAMNPSPPPPPTDTTFYITDDASGLAWIFFINILINASIISGAFLISSRALGGRLGGLDRSPKSFFVLFVLGIAVVTVIGAVVDFYLVTEVVFWPGPYGISTTDIQVHAIHVDALFWSIACLLIFISVFVAMLSLRIRLIPSALIGGIVTVFNPVWWLLTLQFGEDVTYFSILFSLFAAPILVAGVVKWHANERKSASVDKALDASG